jgi:hypothetical protein
MKFALERLGYGKCYHIQEMCEQNHLEAWDVENADYQQRNFPEIPNFERILNGYGSGVDVPFCIFYKELFEMFPDSKVILNVRDPKKWYRSCYDTIYKYDGLPEARIAAYENVPELKKLWDWEVKTHWGPWDFANAESAQNAYVNYMDEVRATIPKKQLLEFTPGDGWSPLCRFLECDVPKEEYPNINSTKEQLSMAENVEALGQAILDGKINPKNEEEFGDFVRQTFGFSQFA